MPTRLLLLALFAAACASGGPEPPARTPDDPGQQPAGADRPAPTDEGLRERARAAGLSDAQARQLVALDVAAVVPELPDGWTLTSLHTETIEESAIPYPSYTLAYRRADGACFSLDAASEGIGDVFFDEPPHSREVEVPGIATFGPAYVGWSGPGETAEGWETPRVQTEWFGADGVFYNLGTMDDTEGCRPISVEEATAILQGLRYLDPGDDRTALGPMMPMETMEEGANPDDFTGRTPDAAARRTFQQGDAREMEIATLRQTARRAVVLVTWLGLADDSIRDERVRVVYQRDGNGVWVPSMLGKQVRCHAGRGHQDWGAEPCV
ncbi:MAG TPA: hypothetical protein VD962_13590 [Rubricoccaceae bacterium]|nr:hypothetical protein [Rubricoccaceae bacterium]